MRKFTLTKLFILCLLSGMIIACSNSSSEVGFVRDDNRDYQNSYSVPPLKMPPGVKEVRPDPYYVIPNIEQPSGQAVSLVPPDSLLMKQMKG